MPHQPTPRRHLRRHRRGVLLTAQGVIPLRFIADPADGALVAPFASAAFDEAAASPSLTLFVPDESDDSMQLLVAIAPLDPARDHLADRWQAYHGPPRAARWATLAIESARLGAEVYDGEALMAPNPLAHAEPALCKRLNADRAALAAACERRTGVRPADPVAVGVDPDGVDVRARFDILRLEFDPPASDADAARDAVERLLAP